MSTERGPAASWCAPSRCRDRPEMSTERGPAASWCAPCCPAVDPIPWLQRRQHSEMPPRDMIVTSDMCADAWTGSRRNFVDILKEEGVVCVRGGLLCPDMLVVMKQIHISKEVPLTTLHLLNSFIGPNLDFFLRRLRDVHIKEIEYMTGGKYNHLDPTTVHHYFDMVFPSHGYLNQAKGAGHSAAAWEIRLNCGVISLFETIWGKSYLDLIGSVDGFGFWQENASRGYDTGRDWFHRDQNCLDDGRVCYQAQVILYDSKPCDHGLHIFPGTHKRSVIDDLTRHFLSDPRKVKKFTKDKVDFIKFDAAECDFLYDQGYEPVKIDAKAGDVIIWNSACIHCGLNPKKPSQRDLLIPGIIPTRLSPYRSVFFTCFVPKQHGDDEYCLVRKLDAIEKGHTMSHHPRDFRIFPKAARTYSKEQKERNDEVVPLTFCDKWKKSKFFACYSPAVVQGHALCKLSIEELIELGTSIGIDWRDHFICDRSSVEKVLLKFR